MSSSTGADAGRDGTDGGLEERLGRLGDALWLTSVGLALSVVVLVAFPLSAAALATISPALGLAVSVLGLFGALYFLFGDWDWSPDGEARQHATFLVLAIGIYATLETLTGIEGSHGGPSFLLTFVALAVAGWLAYLGGFERLVSLIG